MKSTPIIIGIVGIALIGGMSAVIAKAPTPQEKTSREVALTCTTDMATQFHIHSELKIMVNGKPETLPSEIGIEPKCMRSLHTHDASGKIHIEAPEKKDFTLDDFFAVWQKPLKREGFQLKAAANGSPLENPETYVMKDEDQIVLSYISLKQ